MKKIILLVLTAAFVFTLSSCEQKDKKQTKSMHKEKKERRRL